MRIIWSLAAWRKFKTGAVDIALDLPITPIDRCRKHPWHMLAKGGSFYVPQRGKSMKKLWNSLTSSRAWAQRKKRSRFTMRKDGDGIRVWRTK